ncbi:MAG: SRPBCC family protein [Candidatus Limnocylindria bacterium]
MRNAGRLDVTKSGERETVVTRRFDAPRSAVFDAWTKPDLLGRWFGPKGWSLVACEIDLRVGGIWRFVVRRANGSEIAMRGVYREIVRPGLLGYSQTFDLEDFPGESLVTMTLVEDRGRTTLTQTVLYPSQELRDGDLGPTEHGATESFERLDEHLASIS